MLEVAPPKRAWNSGEAMKPPGEAGQRLAVLHGVDPEVEAALVGQAVERGLVQPRHPRRRVVRVHHQPAVGEGDDLGVRQAVGARAGGHHRAPAGQAYAHAAEANGAHGRNVVSRAAVEPIVASPADQGVVTGAGIDGVVAGEGVDPVRAVGADQKLVARARTLGRLLDPDRDVVLAEAGEAQLQAVADQAGDGGAGDRDRPAVRVRKVDDELALALDREVEPAAARAGGRQQLGARGQGGDVGDVVRGRAEVDGEAAAGAGQEHAVLVIGVPAGDALDLLPAVEVEREGAEEAR